MTDPVGPLSPRAQNNAKDADSDSLLRMAESFLIGNNYAGALNLFNQAAVAHPGDPRPLVGMADIYWKMGHRDRASQYYRRVLVLDPKNADAAAGVAVNMIHAGRPKSAVSFINEFIGTTAGTAALFNALGVAYDLSGSHDGAQLAYADGLDISPEDPEILNNLALSFAIRGDYETAIGLMRRAMDAPGTDGEGRQNLALIYALSGQLDTAVEIATTVLGPEDVQRNKVFYGFLPGLSQEGKAEAVFLGRLPIPGAEPEPDPEQEAEPLFQTEMTTSAVADASEKPKSARRRAADIVNTPDPIETEPELEANLEANLGANREALAALTEYIPEEMPEVSSEPEFEPALEPKSESETEPGPEVTYDNEIEAGLQPEEVAETVVKEPNREKTAAERAAEIVNAMNAPEEVPKRSSQDAPEEALALDQQSDTQIPEEELTPAKALTPEEALAAAIDAELDGGASETDVMTSETVDEAPQDPQVTADVPNEMQDEAASETTEATTEAIAEYAPYWVQLGSYGSMERVYLGWDTLNRSHGDLLGEYDGFAQRRELEDGAVIRYRLMVDAYETRDAANEVCAGFKDQGLDCLVIKTSDDISPLDLKEDSAAQD